MVVVAVVILIVNIEKFLHPHGAQIELSPTNRSGRDWAQIRLCVLVCVCVAVAVALVVGVNWVSVCWHVCALCCLGLSSAASVRACVCVGVCVLLSLRNVKVS